MTETELREWICRAAARPSSGPQPPFVEAVLEVHPDDPVDYEAVRAAQYVALLGEPDRVYRPALGAPHVGIHQFPPRGERDHWTYITSGMSDFPQVDEDGAELRTELVSWTREENALAVNLLHSLSLLPFKEGTAMRTPAALAFDEPHFSSFAHVLVLESGVAPWPAELELGGEPVRLLFVVALSAAEYELATGGATLEWLQGFLADTDPWMLDGRFGLDMPLPDDAAAASSAVAGLGCLEEATGSPCPQCGSDLHEAAPSESTEPVLVCRDCGWTAMASAVEYTRPYLWVVERFRQVFGAEAVEIDALPDGAAVMVRVHLEGKMPVIVELKNAGFDINREAAPESVLEQKLGRSRAHFGIGGTDGSTGEA